MVVLGAGAGGLVSAAGSAGVGAKVAIIEKNLMGGEPPLVTSICLASAEAVLKVRSVTAPAETLHCD